MPVHNQTAVDTFHTVAGCQPYLDNWHIQAIAWHLTKCFTGNINRLIICVPPRYLKSIATSVAFLAWALGHDPALRIICARYSSELTSQHSHDFPAVMMSD